MHPSTSNKWGLLLKDTIVSHLLGACHVIKLLQWRHPMASCRKTAWAWTSRNSEVLLSLLLPGCHNFNKLLKRHQPRTWAPV